MDEIKKLEKGLFQRKRKIEQSKKGKQQIDRDRQKRQGNK